MRACGKTEPVERVTEDQVSMCTLPSPLFGGWIFCSDERPGVPLSLHSGLYSAAPFGRSCRPIHQERVTEDQDPPMAAARGRAGSRAVRATPPGRCNPISPPPGQETTAYNPPGATRRVSRRGGRWARPRPHAQPHPTQAFNPPRRSGAHVARPLDLRWNIPFHLGMFSLWA